MLFELSFYQIIL